MVALLAGTLMISTADAAYVMSIVNTDTGLSTGVTAPGETVTLAVMLQGTAAFDSFGFGIGIDSPNSLRYGPSEYTLAPDRGALFVTRGANDFSEVPDVGNVFPSSATLGNAYFTALTETGGTFWDGDGRLVTLEVTVDPATSAGAINVLPLVDFFSNGFDAVDVAAGVGYTIIVPEPATLALLGIGGLLAIRRRFAA